MSESEHINTVTMEDKIMQRAIEIVERYHLSGNKLPRLLIVRDTPQREQEFKDAQKLKNWKKYLNVCVV